MAWSPGNSENKDGCSNGSTKETKHSGKRVYSLKFRMGLHEKLQKNSKCDLETPASLIANVNIKQLLTPAAFDSLPTRYQNELIQLLPETDCIALDDTETPYAMTVNALSNEFFAKSCVEYRDRLRNGEFCTPSTTNSRTDIEPVVWECDSQVLQQERHLRSDIPKAGEPFICSSRKSILSRTAKSGKKPRLSDSKKMFVNKIMKSITTSGNSKSLLKSSKPITSTGKSTSASVHALKAVSKAKAVSNLKTREKETVTQQPPVAGVKRPRSEALSSENPKTMVTMQTQAVRPVSSTLTNPSQVVITKFKKVTENGSSGEKVTKVVPVIVRNPHGQVVTTLANCNPLLTQMIKKPVNSQTLTAVPIQVERKLSLLPKILKRDNHVIVTLRSQPAVSSNKNGINRAVTEVISKVKTKREQQSQQPTRNGNSRPTPVIVTVNGSNGSLTSKLIATAVNMERSRQICDTSKQNPPTLNLERSYQICKQVLGKTEGATIVVVGPGGKKKIISKPVRNRLVGPPGANQNSYCSSDIPIYRNKHRGKSTLTLSGHVFLAMKKDEDGYATKAYKRKTAFKQKPKKKLGKLAGKKVTPSGSVTKTTDTSNSEATATDSAVTISSASNITLVTNTLHATEPVLSVSESKSNFASDVLSLLDSCMCNKRALIICRKCGVFCHAECTNRECCLACLGTER